MDNHSKKILEYIEREIVATTSDIAKLLKISWNTAESYLKDLALDNLVHRIKKEGVNLWVKKSLKLRKEYKEEVIKEEHKKEISYV